VISGDHDHLDIFVLVPEVLQDGKAIDVGKADVEDDHIRGMLHKGIETVRSRSGGIYRVSFLRQIEIEAFRNGTVVVNHQNFCHKALLIVTS